jgi:hypothetical protein
LDPKNGRRTKSALTAYFDRSLELVDMLNRPAVAFCASLEGDARPAVAVFSSSFKMSPQLFQNLRASRMSSM